MAWRIGELMNGLLKASFLTLLLQVVLDLGIGVLFQRDK